MPKVSHLTTEIDSTGLKKFEIHYNSRLKFQIKGLPAEFCELADFVPDGHETEDQLWTAFQVAKTKYRERKRQQRNVILYRCSASSSLRMNPMSSGADGEPNGWSGTREGVSEKIDDLSITVGRSVAAIGIEYRRAVIVDDGVKVEFYKVTPTFEVLGFMGALGTSWSVMDYSDDAWAFFERIEASMRKMLDDASAFFGLEPEQAKLLIESNGVKFLSAGDK